MKSILPFLRFDRLQRYGLIVLLSIVLCAQSIYFFVVFSSADASQEIKPWPEMEAALAKVETPKPAHKKIWPFNPNFISDYKGYQLGLSLKEIDRLQAFRDKGLFVNSAAEFQKVTGVSDQLLQKISPFFKFPDWVTKKAGARQFLKFSEKTFQTQDINLATAEDLEAVYGIGEVLSKRIIETRDKLGGFASIEQLSIVYGVRSEVIEKTGERFFAKAPSTIKKLNLNEASLKQIAAFPYFNYGMAKRIISARTMNGKIQSTEDLAKIVDLSAYNLNLLALYLEL